MQKNIAKMLLGFFSKFKIIDFTEVVLIFFVKNLLHSLGGFSQNLKYRYIEASRYAVQIYLQIGL